eukprot:1430056-Amphidinium_carterae.1
MQHNVQHLARKLASCRSHAPEQLSCNAEVNCCDHCCRINLRMLLLCSSAASAQDEAGLSFAAACGLGKVFACLLPFVNSVANSCSDQFQEDHAHGSDGWPLAVCSVRRASPHHSVLHRDHRRGLLDAQ